MIEISRTEYQIMEVIWQLAPCHSKDIVDALNQHDDWHEKTVKTLIGRLVKKGAISFKKQGRQYIYQAEITPQDYKIKESESFLGRLFNGKLSPFVSAFAHSNKLTQNDIDELKDIIKKWEKNND